MTNGTGLLFFVAIGACFTIIIGSVAAQGAAAAVCGGVCRTGAEGIEDCSGQDCGCVCRNGLCVANLVLQQPSGAVFTAHQCTDAKDIQVADQTSMICPADAAIPCSDTSAMNCCPEGCGPLAAIYNLRKVDSCCTMFVNCTTVPDSYWRPPYYTRPAQ